jgi:hypothetical protein
MKVVFCINDKDLPLGAHVVEGQIYEVEYEYINGYEQALNNNAMLLEKYGDKVLKGKEWI